MQISLTPPPVSAVIPATNALPNVEGDGESISDGKRLAYNSRALMSPGVKRIPTAKLATIVDPSLLFSEATALSLAATSWKPSQIRCAPPNYIATETTGPRGKANILSLRIAVVANSRSAATIPLILAIPLGKPHLEEREPANAHLRWAGQRLPA